MCSPPPLRFPQAVQRDLEKQRTGLADETERMMAAYVRPCVAITAERVAKAPLRRNALASMFGARPAEPVLGVVESKFGGVPYADADEDWTDYAFLGQIDLSAATAVLPPDAPKLRGLLRIDLAARRSFVDALRVRWFRHPLPEHRVDVVPRSVGEWETRLAFACAWSLPQGDGLEAIWPLREPKWFDYEQFYPTDYNTDGGNEYHRLLGHRATGLDEHYGFTPPPGCSDDIADYESLLRITFDSAAGFSWGTNWLYLLVPCEDLARGEPDRVVCTGANS
jgi:hypothetical protein